MLTELGHEASVVGVAFYREVAGALVSTADTARRCGRGRHELRGH
jgi:hypothetical protein